MSKSVLLALALSGPMLLPPPAHADVTVGINIAPPPPIVVTTPPQLVVVPGSPVAYAPGVSFNLFVFGGQYYSLHNGAWFHARSQSGPWVVIAPERVPRPVLAVPVSYYKVPPGHAKKFANGDDSQGRGNGPKGGKGRGH